MYIGIHIQILLGPKDSHSRIIPEGEFNAKNIQQQ